MENPSGKYIYMYNPKSTRNSHRCGFVSSRVGWRLLAGHVRNHIDRIILACPPPLPSVHLQSSHLHLPLITPYRVAHPFNPARSNPPGTTSVGFARKRLDEFLPTNLIRP